MSSIVHKLQFSLSLVALRVVGHWWTFMAWRPAGPASPPPSHFLLGRAHPPRALRQMAMAPCKAVACLHVDWTGAISKSSTVMGGAWRGNEGGDEGGEDGERSPSRVASRGGSRRRPNRRKSAGIRRQARHRDDTERTQTRHAHGALALWQSCVLPAKIRLGEGEASCRPHSDAARLKSAASVRLRRMGVANWPTSSKREGF